MEKVSIVVPVYNTESYLRECLESIHRQSYKNIEVIVIDDGSTDDSSLICDEFAKKDDRFIIFHTANHGLSAARNIGLRNATGDYLCFVDSDDKISPEMVSVLVTTAKQAEADIVICGMQFFYVNHIRQRKTPPKVGYLSKNEYIGLVYSLGPWDGCRCNGGRIINKLFSKRIIDKLMFIDDRTYCEDEPFCLQAIERAQRIFLVDQDLYYYRERQSSVSKKSTFAQKGINGRRYVFEHLSSEFKNLTGVGLLDSLVGGFKEVTDISLRRKLSSEIKQLPQYASGLNKKKTFYFRLARRPEFIINLFFVIQKTVRRLISKEKREKYQKFK